MDRAHLLVSSFEERVSAFTTQHIGFRLGLNFSPEFKIHQEIRNSMKSVRWLRSSSCNRAFKTRQDKVEIHHKSRITLHSLRQGLLEHAYHSIPSWGNARYRPRSYVSTHVSCPLLFPAGLIPGSSGVWCFLSSSSYGLVPEQLLLLHEVKGEHSCLG